MPTNSDKTVPILPFDITLDENFVIYKQKEYIRDRDLLQKVGISKESGNICKYYTIKEVKPFKVGEKQPGTEEE